MNSEKSIEEIIYGVIANATGVKSLWGTTKDYDLIFTNKRIIVAMTANSGTAMAFGGALGWAISKSGRDKRRERYQQMSAEEIARAHSKNFSISYSDIQSVRIVKFLGYGTIIIKWPGGPLKMGSQFNFPGKHLDTALRMVNMFLSDKIEG